VQDIPGGTISTKWELDKQEKLGDPGKNQENEGLPPTTIHNYF
jgi:hypothetical protein